MNSDLQKYILNDEHKFRIYNSLYNHDKFRIYNLLYTNFGEIANNWEKIKSEIGIQLFYDILFEILHIDYMYKLKNNIFIHKYSILQNFRTYYDKMIISENSSNLITELKKYLFDKHNIENVEKYDKIQLTLNDFKEYVYFKKSPNLLYKIKYQENNKKIKIQKGSEVNGFYWEYFIWRKKDDENLKTAPQSLEITKDNFYNYKIFKTSLHGWNKLQLNTFLYTVIIPEFLKQANLKINTQHKLYQDIFKHFLPKSNVEIGILIEKYISGKKLNNHILEIIDETINSAPENSSLAKIFKLLDKKEYNELVKEDEYINVYKLITHLKYNKRIMNMYLSKKIEKIRKKFIKKRFKWQLMCAELTKTTNIQTLRELALLENIENASMMTKREICKAFGEKLQKIIDDKNNAINNNKCINDSSFLSGENIQDIQAEFFIEYEHNNKIYCDDIRLMKKQIDENNQMHPSFREKLSDTAIKKINDMYDKLLKTTINMEDRYIITEELSPESYLQSQTTNLVLKTRDNGYINNQELFIKSDEKLFDKFIDKLLINKLLSDKEIEYIKNFNTLLTKKTKLVELLSLKIDNDPLKQGNISEIATNFVILYNEIFS